MKGYHMKKGNRKNVVFLGTTDHIEMRKKEYAEILRSDPKVKHANETLSEWKKRMLARLKGIKRQSSV